MNPPPMTPLEILIRLVHALLALLVIAFCLRYLVWGCSSPENESLCERSCNRTLHCPNDPDPRCLEHCEDLQSQCPNEANAYARCTANIPQSQLFCDDEGRTDGHGCDRELQALARCVGP